MGRKKVIFGALRGGEIVSINGVLVFIYKGIDRERTFGSTDDAIIYYAYTNIKCGITKVGCGIGVGYPGLDLFKYYYATKKEQKLLFDRLNAMGYAWNPETMSIDEVGKPNSFKVISTNKFGHRFIEEPNERILFRMKCKHLELGNFCKKDYFAYTEEGGRAVRLEGCTAGVKCPRLQRWDRRHGLVEPYSMVPKK